MEVVELLLVLLVALVITPHQGHYLLLQEKPGLIKVDMMGVMEGRVEHTLLVEEVQLVTTVVVALVTVFVVMVMAVA